MKYRSAIGESYVTYVRIGVNNGAACVILKDELKFLLNFASDADHSF